jgi:hypothetical protein
MRTLTSTSIMNSESQQVRSREYALSMSVMAERVSQRPTIIERQKVLVARQSMQSRFTSAMKKIGHKPSDIPDYVAHVQHFEVEQEIQHVWHYFTKATI